DAFLAIASAKLNLEGEQVHFHQTDSLGDFTDASLDLVVSNPPFHLGYENNIEVSLRLFEEVSRVLRPGGSFQLVANRHLNYGTHLEPLFKQVKLMAEDKRFVVWGCLRG
ncbi:MAG: methyltransferase, partial [Bacteroidota bacterium]